MLANVAVYVGYVDAAVYRKLVVIIFYFFKVMTTGAKRQIVK